MKLFTGTVISTKMAKTATVAVERIVAHPVYKKRIKKVKKYHVHDEQGVKVGDIVKFVASAPVSKLKKWKIVEVVKDTKKGK
jgi:small subunit ribosomal protein S17